MDVSETYSLLHARIRERTENTQTAFFFANAYLRLTFDHEDFALLTATSRRLIARRIACLAPASKTLTLVNRCGHIITHFADRRKV